MEFFPDIHNNHSVLCQSMQWEPEPSDAETLSDESDSDSWESEDEADNRKRYSSFPEESSSDDLVVEEPSSEKLSSPILKQENDVAVNQSGASCSPGFINAADVKSEPTEESGFNFKNYIHLIKGNSSSKKDSGNVNTACVSSVSKCNPGKRDVFNGVTNTSACNQVSLLDSSNQHKKDAQKCLSLNQNRKPVSQKSEDAVIGSSLSTVTKMGESATNCMSTQVVLFKGATKKLVSTSHEEFSGEDSRIQRRYREPYPNSTYSPVASVISPAYKRAGNLNSSKNTTVETIASPQSQIINITPFESKTIKELYFRIKGNISCSLPSTDSTRPLPGNSNVTFPDHPSNECARVSSECVDDTITGSIEVLSLGTPGVPNGESSGKQNTKIQEKASHGFTSVAVNDAKYSTSLQLTKVARQTSRKVKTEYLGTAKNTLLANEGPCGIKTGRSSNLSLSPSELLSNLNLGSPNDFRSKSERQLQNVNKSRNRKHSESVKTKANVDIDKNANCVKPGFVRKLKFSSSNFGKNLSDRTQQKMTTACANLSDNILKKRIENTIISSDESKVDRSKVDKSKVDESFNPTRPDAKSFRVPALCPLLDTRNVGDDDDDHDCSIDLLDEIDDEIEAIEKGKSEIDDTNSDDGFKLVCTTSTPTKDKPCALFDASFISSISESSEITRIKEIAMKTLDETVCSVSSVDCTSALTEEDQTTAKGFGMQGSENLATDDATLRQLSDDNSKTLFTVPTKPYFIINNETYLISPPEKTSSVPAKFICSLRLERLGTPPSHFSAGGKAKVGLRSVDLRSQTGLSNFQKTKSNDVRFELKRRASKRHRSSSSSSSDVEKKMPPSNVNSNLMGIKPVRLTRSKVHVAYNTRQNASPGSYKNAFRMCSCCETK